MRDPLPDAHRRTLVIGLGNTYRGDDSVGLEVARVVRERAPDVDVVEHEGEPIRLLDLWEGAAHVVVVDAARGTGRPGTVTTIDATERRLPRSFFATSTHHVSVGEAVELARALGTLPPRTTIVAVEAAAFDTGAGLSEPAAAAVAIAVEEVLRCTSGS